MSVQKLKQRCVVIAGKRNLFTVYVILRMSNQACPGVPSAAKKIHEILHH